MTHLLRMRLAWGSLAVAGCALAGCQTRQAASAAATTETSVKPGINAEFPKPSLNLTQWVERFERQGREIFTEREKIVAAAKKS